MTALPWAVSYLQKIGLPDEVSKFPASTGSRYSAPSEWELSFPRRPGMPMHGHVARRRDLDTLPLKTPSPRAPWCASPAEVDGPVLDDTGG